MWVFSGYLVAAHTTHTFTCEHLPEELAFTSGAVKLCGWKAYRRVSFPAMAPKMKTYGSAGEMISAGYAGGRGSQDPPLPVALEASSGGAMTDAPKRRLVSQAAYERPTYCEGFQIVAQEGPRLVIPDGHSGSSEVMDGEQLVTTDLDVVEQVHRPLRPQKIVGSD